MFLHSYNDAYRYAAQALELEATRIAPAREEPAGIIPLRWIMTWFGAVCTLAFIIGMAIKWLA